MIDWIARLYVRTVVTKRFGPNQGRAAPKLTRPSPTCARTAVADERLGAVNEW